MNKIVQHTLKTSVINYFGVIIGFISVLFIQTKVLNETEIGVIRLILDKGLLVLPFFMLGLHSVASRFFFHFENEQKEYSKFISFLFLVPLVTSVIGYSVFYISDLYQSIPNFFFIAFVLFFNLYITIIESYLTTKFKIIYPAFLRNILFRVLFIILLGFYYLNLIGFEFVLIIYSLLYLIHFLLISIYLYQNLTYKVKFSLKIYTHPIFKEIKTYSLFLILGAGSGVLITKLDTIMIEGLTNSQAFVGIYTIALAMASIIEVPRRPLVKLSIPILAKKLKENKLGDVSAIYKKSAINLLIVGSIIFLFIWLNIDLIFHLIPNGKVYAGGKFVVFFLGAAKLIDLAVGLNNEILQSSKYYRWNIFLMPLLAVVSISTNYYFIGSYGYLGAAIATLISMIFFNLARTIIVYLKMNLNPFDLNYFKVILLFPLPIAISLYVSSNNVYFNFLINGLAIFITFILPIYYLNVSKDLNQLIQKGINKLKK